MDYSVSDIIPKPPEPVLLQDASENRREEEIGVLQEILESKKKVDWKTKLKSIKPGTGQFHAYELICTEILKYVLGDYLTLWEV